jgi:hypothetical protein
LDGRGRAVVSANGCTRADVGAGRPADVKRLVSARGGCRARVRGRARPGTADRARVYAYARDAIVAINSCWAWALACALVLVWLCGLWCSGLARSSGVALGRDKYLVWLKLHTVISFSL